MATAEDFTSNEIIDNFEVGDNTIDIIGYVVCSNNNLHTPSKSKYKKFVVSNGSGREVQVIAWNSNTKIVDDVKELGRIVHFGSLKCNAVKSKAYNSGNVNFELLVKENSSVTVYDIYRGAEENLMVEDVTIIDAYKKIGSTVKIDAIIKSEPALYKNRDYEMIVTSITDCIYQLEVKLNFDCKGLNIVKGSSVELTGIMERYPPGPAILRVDSRDNVKILDRERVPFQEILNGFRTKEVEVKEDKS